MEEQKSSGDLETWALVEVMGHSRYAGFVRQVAMGGAAMIRVDVPAVAERREEYDGYEDDAQGNYKPVRKVRIIPAVPAFTKFLGVAAIFAITPCTEETARAATQRFRAEPANVLDIAVRKALPSYRDEE